MIAPLLVGILEQSKSPYVNKTAIKQGILRLLHKFPQAKMNTSSFPDDVYSSFIADKIRVVLKHGRELAGDPALLMAHLRQCSGDQATRVQQLVALLQDTPGCMVDGPGNSGEQVHGGWGDKDF